MITEWLLEQIAQDEAAATVRAAGGRHASGVMAVTPGETLTVHVGGMAGNAETFASRDRALVECAAKRQTVALHTVTSQMGEPVCNVCNLRCSPADGNCAQEPWPCTTLRAVASVYADRAGYREEWAL